MRQCVLVALLVSLNELYLPDFYLADCEFAKWTLIRQLVHPIVIFGDFVTCLICERPALVITIKWFYCD